MQANWRVGSLMSSVRVITLKRYGWRRTTMRNTSAEVRPAVNLQISSNSFTPNASFNARATAGCFASGIILAPGISLLGSNSARQTQTQHKEQSSKASSQSPRGRIKQDELSRWGAIQRLVKTRLLPIGVSLQPYGSFTN